MNICVKFQENEVYNENALIVWNPSIVCVCQNPQGLPILLSLGTDQCIDTVLTSALLKVPGPESQLPASKRASNGALLELSSKTILD